MEAKLTKHVYNARRVDLENQIKSIRDQINTAGRVHKWTGIDHTLNSLYDRLIIIDRTLTALDRQWENSQSVDQS